MSKVKMCKNCHGTGMLHQAHQVFWPCEQCLGKGAYDLESLLRLRYTKKLLRIKARYLLSEKDVMRILGVLRLQYAALIVGKYPAITQKQAAYFLNRYCEENLELCELHTVYFYKSKKAGNQEVCSSTNRELVDRYLEEHEAKLKKGQRLFVVSQAYSRIRSKF